MWPTYSIVPFPDKDAYQDTTILFCFQSFPCYFLVWILPPSSLLHTGGTVFLEQFTMDQNTNLVCYKSPCRTQIAITVGRAIWRNSKGKLFHEPCMINFYQPISMFIIYTDYFHRSPVSCLFWLLRLYTLVPTPMPAHIHKQAQCSTFLQLPSNKNRIRCVSEMTDDLVGCFQATRVLNRHAG